MKPVAQTHSGSDSSKSVGARLFCLLTGLWLGISLLKFGNPVILDRLIDPPNDFWEWVLAPWPVRWGYGMLFVIMVAAAPIIKSERSGPKWLLWAPLIWLGCQALSYRTSIDPALSKVTLVHFSACVAAFCLGHFALSNIRKEELGWFWLPIAAGFVIVLLHGLSQRFGGLDETIKMVKEQPGWEKMPQDYLLRLMGKRVFATLVYPNAFACVLLLFLPIVSFTFWSRMTFLTPVSRAFLGILCALTGLACLYWTGSKSGWLIAVVVSVAALLNLDLGRRVKLALAGLILVAALTGFFARYSSYFEKGATSVSARGDYWKAAMAQFRKTPWTGSGPGTFGVIYKLQKSKESEMALLTHNDYLEQASDSGIIGFLSYGVFTIGYFLYLYRYRNASKSDLCLILGLLGWLLQSAVEFTLYIPAIAWSGFLFLGWLTAASKRPVSAESISTKLVK